MSVSSFAASDSVSAALGYALDGLALRQRTIADNIANVDTPGFRARYVDFESTLAAAVNGGETSGLLSAGVTSQAVNTPVGANGNNVDLRKETLAAVQSQFQYQMVSRAVSDRFELTKIVAAG